MWTLPYSTRRKIRIVLYGLAAGAAATVLTSAALFLVGIALAILGNMGWLHLGEYQPWLPIIGLEYGFILGIIIGSVVCWKVASPDWEKSRLDNLSASLHLRIGASLVVTSVLARFYKIFQNSACVCGNLPYSSIAN
jgi:hypothetical protein